MSHPWRSRLIGLSVLLSVGLGAWLFANAPISPKQEMVPKTVYPICQGEQAWEIKEGLIERTEDEGAVVYVADAVWNRTPIDEKDDVGYFLALCRSEKDRVEIRSAETGEKLQNYVIDLHYKMTHGLM